MLIGFGRNLALAAAIGTGLVADSYNIANQVPNQIFLLLGGGTIAFVLVPQLMRHARTSAQRSDEYGSFLLFAGAVIGIVLTIVLLALSPFIIRLMGGSSWSQAQSELGFQLSLWCIPQVFFYAMYSVVSQLMNARGRFSAVAWAPGANSVLIILACIPIVTVGAVSADSPKSLRTWEVALLGGSTLCGAALQTLLLVYLLRRAGFRLHFRFQVRGLGLRATASTALLTILSAACFQLANLVTAAYSTQAGSAAKSLGYDGRGYTSIVYAQTLLAVAQGVAAASLANILLQRLSRHYADGDRRTASSELNDAILAVGALLIPAMSIFICLGPLGTELLFTRGETSASAARFIGIVLAVLAIGLLPYALHDLLIRPFYAVHDAKTPLRSAVIIGTVRIGGTICASLVLPPEWVPLGIAAAFALAYFMDFPLKLRSLKTNVDFKISGAVSGAYWTALSAAAVAATVIAVCLNYLEGTFPHHWLPRTVLFFGGIVGFFAIYYPLTARSPASLRRLLQWLRT
jgi:putative peptidoglycan lipid II flippase